MQPGRRATTRRGGLGRMQRDTSIEIGGKRPERRSLSAVFGSSSFELLALDAARQGQLLLCGFVELHRDRAWRFRRSASRSASAAPTASSMAARSCATCSRSTPRSCAPCPELVLILLLYFAGTDLVNQVLTALGRPADRHQRPRRRHRRARLRARRLLDRGAARRHPRHPAGPDRGGARLRHVAGIAAAAHHAAGHAALRHSRPCQSLADRHQGHGAARDRWLQRTDAGDAHRPAARPRPTSPSSSPPAPSIWR